MNEILIVPDVHGRKFWREAVEKYPDVRTIFLGDYHDPYPQEKISEKDSLANFKEILEYAASHDNVQLLLGNHDLHYLCNFGEGCRLDYDNSAEIHGLLCDNLPKMKIVDVLQVGGKTVMFSHAPVLTGWIEQVGLSERPDEIAERLNSLLESIIIDPWTTEKFLGYVSEWRGGYDSFGSPVWADMREIDGNLLPTADYSIFGHTQMADAVIAERWANLDCRKSFLLTHDLKLKPLCQSI